MTTVPCEHAHWHIIPMIRRELAIYLVEVSKFSQSDAARKLDVTPAAICQYLSGKRGNNNLNEQFELEIARSADRIKNNSELVVQYEICRLCSLIRKKNNSKF